MLRIVVLGVGNFGHFFTRRLSSSTETTESGRLPLVSTSNPAAVSAAVRRCT